jgi:hypothetical protein
MDFKTLGQPPGFLRRENQVQVGETMGIEIILHQADFLGVGITYIG